MTKKIPKNRQNEQYWLNREKQQQAYIDKNLASDEQYNKVIQAQYDSLLADINKRIDSELSKLANENGISIADMRAKVSQTDIKQFEAEAKRVVAQADKMRKQGKSPKLADWSQEVNDRLRLYNATMRINRLEYLKAGIGLDMITAGLQVDSELRDKLFKDATEEQKRQAGILGENNAHIDTLAIGNIILAKTKSNNFSQRIWTNMDVLQAKLSQTIMVGITTGQSYDEMARRLKTQVSKDVQNVTYATQRIARTEAARVQTEITMNSLKRNGYDFCKWYKEPSACHDCALIGNQDNGWGKGIYKVKDVPTIPVHPNCRCAVGAYWVDEDNFLTTDVNVIRERLDKYHDDFLEATGINVSDSIRNGTFSDTSNPQNDVKAKFVNYLLEQKGYTQLPKQVKEYSGTKVYRGVHRSIDGKKSADDIDKELRTEKLYISGANSSSKGRGIYFSEFEFQAKMHAKYGEGFKIFEYGISSQARVIKFEEATNLLYSVKKIPLKNNLMDFNIDVIAIVAGYDIIQRGATLNVLNRGVLEWKK